RGQRAVVAALVQLTSPDLGDRQVGVGGAGQHLKDLGPLGVAQRGRRRGRRRPRAVHRALRVGVTVMRGPRDSGQLARCRHRDLRRAQFGECGVHDLVGGRSFSALPESSSKSACAFPMISSASLVFANSDLSLSFSRRSFSSSIRSAVFLFGRSSALLPQGASGVAPPVPRTPASRARAHSIICEEYKPSRRRMAPFSPFGAFSYSVRTANLYSELNARRDGRGAGSAGSASATGSAACSGDDEVNTCSRISDPALSQDPGTHSGCLT